MDNESKKRPPDWIDAGPVLGDVLVAASRRSPTIRPLTPDGLSDLPELKLWADLAKSILDKAKEEKRVTYRNLVSDAISEAFASDTDEELLMERLIEAMAIQTLWVQQIRRRIVVKEAEANAITTGDGTKIVVVGDTALPSKGEGSS